MSATQPTTREAINVCTTGTLSSYTNQLGFGDFLRSMPILITQQVPAADSYSLSTVQTIRLPDHAKAAFIERAWVRTGTTLPANGELAVQTPMTTPQTTQIAITPSGDIGVLAADALTLVDVQYTPIRGDVYELTLPVSTGILTLPAALTGTSAGVTLLMEAEAITGTVTGKKIVLAPVIFSSLPAAGRACLSLDRTQVLFNNTTDAVATARVKFLVRPAVDANAILEANASF